jgi:hypothetical protein
MSGRHRQHEVQQAADRCGLTDVLQLPRLAANNAYRRAVRAVAARAAAVTDDRGVVVKVVVDEQAQLIHQFLSGSIADTAASNLTVRGAEFGHLVCVRFDKTAYEAGAPPETLVQMEDVPPGQGRELGQAVLDEYNQTAVDVHYTHGDLRTAVVRALGKLAGIPVLDHGGLWFVPVAFDAQVQALQAWVSMLPGCRLVALPQYDVAAVLAEVQARSAQALDAQLADLLEELARFSGSATVRLSTLEARVTAFDDLRGRVECYERLLGNTMDEMKTRLDEAQNALVAALNTIKE